MKKGQIDGGIFFFVFVTVAAIVAVVCLIGFDYVPAGNVGVMDNLGNVNPTSLSPGVYWTGMTTSTHDMDTRIQIKTYSVSAASKDLQVVQSTIALNFRINPVAAPEIYKNIGSNYQDVIIQPVIQEAVKSTTAFYTAEQLISNRTQVKRDIDLYIAQTLEDKGLIVTEVSITDFKFSPEFDAAIERKQVAEQDALTAKNRLEETKYLVEGNKLQQEIIAIKSLEIQEKWVSKWDGRLPQYMMGDSSVFMVQPNSQTINISVSER